MSRVAALIAVGALGLAACDRQPTAPVDEAQLATTLAAEAQAAMNTAGGGPVSILRRLVQGVRESDNADANALLARGETLAQRAAASGDTQLAQQARGLILQAVVKVFPNASTRISGVVRTGVDRVRTSLGSQSAPRIRSALDDIAGLLRRSAAAQDIGRLAVALDLVLQANDRLVRLVEYVRNAGSTTTTR